MSSLRIAKSSQVKDAGYEVLHGSLPTFCRALLLKEDNRPLWLAFMKKHEIYNLNTSFRHPPSKTATYREPGYADLFTFTELGRMGMSFHSTAIERTSIEWKQLRLQVVRKPREAFQFSLWKFTKDDEEELQTQDFTADCVQTLRLTEGPTTTTTFFQCFSIPNAHLARLLTPPLRRLNLRS